MEMSYRRKRTSVSLINYHLVFCPRYRRKIILIEGLESRFKELVHQICERNDYLVLALECDKDHCHLFVQVDPTVSAADVVKTIKTNTSTVLKKEFGHIIKTPTTWTRSYFASTAGNVSAATIAKYIAEQKKHG